jgi:hypothetical protein
LESILKLIDPNLINGKRLAVVGAGDLTVPLLLARLFEPAGLDAIDAEIWRYTLSEVKDRAADAGMNVYPLPDLTADSLISTGATPWDVVFSCVYLEAVEHPLSLLETLSWFAADTLILKTHTSIESDLPVMASKMLTNRMDHAGVYWQISGAALDSYMKFTGFYADSDLMAEVGGQAPPSGVRVGGLGNLGVAPQVRVKHGEYCKLWLKV